jgi:hypothetical protein
MARLMSSFGMPTRFSSSVACASARSTRSMSFLSTPTILSIVFLFSRISPSSATISPWVVSTSSAICFRRAPLASFSSSRSSSIFLFRALTLSIRRMIRRSASSSSKCWLSSVSSASRMMSLTRILCFLSFSPISMISRTAMGDERMDESTRCSPSSMRFAISTSPSRVRSETVPIFRRYIRTGSLDLEYALSASSTSSLPLIGTRLCSAASSSAMRLGAIFTWVVASTISMSSSLSAPMTSSS